MGGWDAASFSTGMLMKPTDNQELGSLIVSRFSSLTPWKMDTGGNISSLANSPEGVAVNAAVAAAAAAAAAAPADVGLCGAGAGVGSGPPSGILQPPSNGKFSCFSKLSV